MDARPEFDEAANAAWVEEQVPGVGAYREGIRSAARCALNAVPGARMLVFMNSVREVLNYAERDGLVTPTPQEATAELFRAIAARNGLEDELGAVAIDRVIDETMAGAPNGADVDFSTDDRPPVADQSEFREPAIERQAPAIIAPLTLLDPSDWQNRTVPPRRWLARERIPAGNVTLLNGDGAAGKTTIALQLAAATPSGRDWLGTVLDTSGPAIFFSAEEDADELHRRLEAIVRHHGIGYADLAGLHLHCRPGEDAVLGQPDRSGIIRPTPLFSELEAAARDIDPALIVIESAADVFAGNENDRSQVRQFIGLLRRLARGDGPAVLLLAHPSLSGLASGTGTSGSTAWNNSVRSRLYFTTPKARGDDEPEPDVRQLQVMKSNYGPAGEAVKLRWNAGVFAPVGTPSTIERVAAESKVDDVFMRCLDAAGAQGLVVSPLDGRNYAPKIFSSMPEAEGLKAPAFKLAMARLMSASRIHNTTIGKGSHAKASLVRKEAE